MKGKSKRKLALEVAELYPPQGEWTEEDYFALPETNRYVELSEGKLIMPPHPTRRHQVAVLELAVRLRQFVRERDLGEVWIAPLPVRLWPGKIREPDILFVAKEHADRIGEEAVGVPDLVVEVVSPSTERIDRVEKFVEYAQAGISEYWLVDLEEGTIEVYALKEGAYILRGRYTRGQAAGSQLLSGFEVPVDDVIS
ncbi:MAG: Uma2 family endonuclease [candidate division NC10 bacterium]|nr:Uma2 family endonuclease [candidate division NC10 bacterium]